MPFTIPRIPRLRRLLAVFASAAAVVVLGAGCGSPRLTGGAALHFTADTVDGQVFSGESLSGKPAVLWFWAPWCPACQREAPEVARVAAAHPAVSFVGVGSRDDLAALQDFATKYGIDTFPQLADIKGMIWAKFGITRQPAFVFIKPDGAVDVVRGSLEETDLTQRVTALAS